MDDDVRLDALRVFTALADVGSIAGAAATLETSRPRIRRQLEQLEETLRTTLFTRSRDGVSLTAEGEELLPGARRLVADARLFVRRAWSQRDEPVGRLRIALQVGYIVPGAAAVGRLLSARFGRVHVEYAIAERPLDLLPDRVDLAICIGEQTAAVPCIELTLGTFQQQLLAAPADLERAGVPTTVDEAIERLVGVWRGPDDAGHTLHLRDGPSRRIDPPVISSDECFLRFMASTGDGLIYAPLPDLSAVPPYGELVPVLPGRVGRDVTARLVVPEALADMPMMGAVLRTLRVFLGEMAGASK